MEDRKVTLLAAAIGTAAIGGFWFARPMPGRAALRLLEQRAVTPKGIGLDPDAAVVFRLRMPNAVRDSQIEGQPISFSLTDSSGRVHPLLPMTDPLLRGVLKLPRGYGEPLVSPRLEARSGPNLLASCAVDPLPAAEEFKLSETPDPPLSLVHRGGDALWIEYLRPPPKGERWRVVARRTAHAQGFEALAQPPPFRGPGATERLLVPYASEAEKVEIEIRRYRMARTTMEIVVPNLRLISRFGGTALVVDRTFIVPNSLGARVIVPRQDLGPKRPVKRDWRIAFVTVGMTPPWQRSEGTFLFRRQPEADVRILEPSPESLGLQELRIAGAVRTAKVAPQGPLKEGVFSAKLRVTFSRPVFIGIRRAVVPVKFAAPMAAF